MEVCLYSLEFKWQYRRFAFVVNANLLCPVDAVKWPVSYSVMVWRVVLFESTAA